MLKTKKTSVAKPPPGCLHNGGGVGGTFRYTITLICGAQQYAHIPPSKKRVVRASVVGLCASDIVVELHIHHSILLMTHLLNPPAHLFTKKCSRKKKSGKISWGGGGRGYDSSHFGWDQTHGKFIWHYLAISKATAGEKHPQSGSQGACGSKNDPEATPEYKKMEKNSEKTAFFTFWPLWAK